MLSPNRLRALAGMLTRAENLLLTRALDSALSATITAAELVAGDLHRRASDTMSMLAKLAHDEADAIADKDRGPNARTLTPAERHHVVEAYGTVLDPGRVRIVPGPGLSLVALSAFIKGNPAITIGNTVYLRWGSKRFDYRDLAGTEGGIGLLLHEYSHVMQYRSLGFARFGARYAAELSQARGDPDKLYDYKSRGRTFGAETIEGQAEMVGDYAVARRHDDPASRALAQRLRTRLAGSGAYGL